MPQYNWYTVPENAKTMAFCQLFLDCCRQAQKNGLANGAPVKPLIAMKWDSLDNVFRCPQATRNVPEPSCLGDLLMLCCGKFSDIRCVVDADCIRDIYAEPVIGLKYCEDIIKFVAECVRHSRNNMWERAMRFGLRVVMEEDLIGGGSGWCRNADLSAPILCLLHLSNILDKSPDLVQSVEFLKKELPFCIDEVLYLTALFGCGLSITTYEWARENLTPLLITFSDVSGLAFVSKNVADKYQNDECKLFVIEGENGFLLLAVDLLSSPYLFCRCLTPLNL